jgi:hypothetical protein
MLPLDPMSLTAVAMVSASLWQPTLNSDTMLWGLERSGSRLTSFSAGIEWDRFKSFEDERERRVGRFALEGQGQSRRLGCAFTEFYSGDGAKRESVDLWVYADGWLGEADMRFKSFTKRRVVAPGESWDPLKLGEGPFPLPFGQPEHEVRARFTVEPVTLPESPRIRLALKTDTVVGLRLTPKPNTPLAKDITTVDVFYSATGPVDGLIPRVVVLRRPNGDESSFLLKDPRMNVPLTKDEQALLTMPNPDPKEWSIDIRDWESAGGTPAGPDRLTAPQASDG